MPTKQATDSSVSFPFTLSHTHKHTQNLFHASQKSWTNPSVGGENKNKTKNMKQTGQ